MSRRTHLAPRCPRCALNTTVCVCGELPQLALKTQLCVVVHRFEARKTTNSGILAARCLGGTVILHGEADTRAESPLPPGGRGLLLFPADDAETLTAEHAAAGPVTLIVPDGTWRQATKMGRRLPWLADLPRVALPPDGPTRYRLRAETRAGGLATMEAIARAFGILEGAAVRAELERVFGLFVSRTLQARGVVEAS